MLALVLALLVLVVFGACQWSGSTLAQHQADREELRAVIVVGLCLFVGVSVLARTALDEATWPLVVLAAAGAVGLVVGYVRAED
jgi:predicted MFS family arabinose efflux permease